MTERRRSGRWCAVKIFTSGDELGREALLSVGYGILLKKKELSCELGTQRILCPGGKERVKPNRGKLFRHRIADQNRENKGASIR